LTVGWALCHREGSLCHNYIDRRFEMNQTITGEET
jgi:hypothetical protein